MPEIVFLLIEDSEQDFNDVREYVREQCILADLEEDVHYSIKQAVNSKIASEDILKLLPTKKLFVISDLHMEGGEHKGDFDQIVRSFVIVDKDSRYGQTPIIIYSQYAIKLKKDILTEMGIKEKDLNKNRPFCTFILKAQRGKQDDRDLLRDSIKKGLRFLQEKNK